MKKFKYPTNILIMVMKMFWRRKTKEEKLKQKIKNISKESKEAAELAGQIILEKITKIQKKIFPK